jgi:hypothetical protein
MTDDELIRQLQSLPREADPPAGVRQAVARAARQPAGTRRRLYWQTAVAASALIATFAAGRWTAPRATSGPQQREFALLLYGGEPSGSPDDHVTEYAAWASKIRGEGRRISGEKLADESWSIGAESANLPLRGFFIVQARDDEDARRLAQAHPHVRYGGGIVVRPIEPTP